MKVLREQLRPFPLVVTLTILSVVWVVVFMSVRAVASTPPAAFLAFAAIGITSRILERPRVGLYAALERVPAGFRALFVAGALAGLIELSLVTVFVQNPAVATFSASPWTPLRSSHSCISAYWVAAHAVERQPNVYADELYNFPQADPKAPRKARPLGPLLIDNFEYPPPFLALPRVIGIVAPDFWNFQRMWFALNLAMVAAALVLVGRRLDGALGTHALWLTPLVMAPPAMMATLQIGNVQLAVIAAAMAAMVLHERGRHAAGGLLLAYATVSKLYPGLLILFLLLRRDWRAVGWTAAASLAIVAVTIADVGVAPYREFFHQLPLLLGGEAFPAFRNPVAMAVNESIPGLAFKLQLWGVPGMGFAVSKVLAWLYTLVVLAGTARLALRPPAPGKAPIAWLVILILATMRSPFLPTYAPFPSLWLSTLLAALAWREGRAIAPIAACWALLAFTFGTGGAPPPLNAAWTLVHTIAAFVLVGIAFRALYAAPAVEPAGALPVRQPVPA
jgi:alpha-1,2-mannosyltransferase